MYLVNMFDVNLLRRLDFAENQPVEFSKYILVFSQHV